ncbi:hypothetical protein EDD22DRAFT_955899 [Suillus occidentalis]|nr:hypothetical protein EDD22DRAFT_955899 [Suillus occidentalis]
MALFRTGTPPQSTHRPVEVLDDPMGDPVARRAEEILRRHAPYPKDDLDKEETLHLMKGYRRLHKVLLEKELEWEDNHLWLLDQGELSPLECALEDTLHQLFAIPDIRFEQTPHHFKLVELNGQQIAQGRYLAIQHNSATTRDFRRLIPKPVVVVVHINSCPTRALINTGSLANFMLSTLADQLKIKRIMLEKPLTIQLAHIKKERFFDIINLQDYNLILGTPFLFQHQVSVGLNLPRVVVGSDKALPVEGEQVSVLESRAAATVEEDLEQARQQLREWAKSLCTKASQTGLPPLWAINHTIPLIDPDRVYKWQPSRCPEPLRPQWGEK